MSDTRKNRYNLENIQSRHASYIKRMSEIGAKDRFNKSIMELGEKWYNEGHKLEDADSKFRTDASFIHGYERAARIDKINSDLYQLGREYFEKGVSLADIPPHYTESKYFLKGFNDAISLSLKGGKPRH